MSDPYKAASKRTQRAVVVAMVVAYVILVVVAGTGNTFVLPIGAFLLLAVGYVTWEWIDGRRQDSAR